MSATQSRESAYLETDKQNLTLNHISVTEKSNAVTQVLTVNVQTQKATNANYVFPHPKQKI